jgi:hypothetical protein
MRRATTLAFVLMVGAAQGAMAASSASAASEMIRRVEDLLLLAAPGELKILETPEKAISRRNVANATVTAPVLSIGEQMFLPDGSSVRVVALALPGQMVPVICRNELATGACARLRIGQRVSTVNDIATFQDGFYHNLSLFYVRTIKTK